MFGGRWRTLRHSAGFPCSPQRTREDVRGGPENPTECQPRRVKTELQGAFGKTSGRSDFPNAPLRATSSATRRSMSDAIAKALPTCTLRTKEQVGFARPGKLLLSFTNRVYKTVLQLGSRVTSVQNNRAKQRLRRAAFLRHWMKRFGFRYNSKTLLCNECARSSIG